jgi:hypothetical protein
MPASRPTDPAFLVGLVRNTASGRCNLEGNFGLLAGARFPTQDGSGNLSGLLFEVLKSALLANPVHDKDTHARRPNGVELRR